MDNHFADLLAAFAASDTPTEEVVETYLARIADFTANKEEAA